ncbi:hypothetical protein CO2235_U770139 [Cupriavidus oxalaticus]|uniref:Uncharacterized protein n=1 Tax=Cupriavidus oxalaticus TaxID=96344 RepID=A0A375FRK1_9BURK|nr:hypothetical protein CO2235_U770139 [Cupriavidus oxalaticus]
MIKEGDPFQLKGIRWIKIGIKLHRAQNFFDFHIFPSLTNLSHSISIPNECSYAISFFIKGLPGIVGSVTSLVR